VHFKTLNECIENFFQQDIIEPRGSYFCSVCSHTQGDAFKKFSLEELPLIICIQLKLFKNTGGKIIKDIQWAEYVDLGKYTSIYDDYHEQVELKYHMFAMVAHYGTDEKTGHYKTFVNNGGWLTLNDEQILNGLNIEEGTPYLLFFERVGCKEEESVVMDGIHEAMDSIENEFRRVSEQCMGWLKLHPGYNMIGQETPMEVQRIFEDLLR
jgi:ubiquitin carboxyl-terminal hydrolase 36/42